MTPGFACAYTEDHLNDDEWWGNQEKICIKKECFVYNGEKKL